MRCIPPIQCILRCIQHSQSVQLVVLPRFTIDKPSLIEYAIEENSAAAGVVIDVNISSLSSTEIDGRDSPFEHQIQHTQHTQHTKRFEVAYV